MQVGVLRELLNYRDGINDIEYFTNGEITLIIDEICTNWYVLYSLVLICILSLFIFTFF